MRRPPEDDWFLAFRERRDPRLLARVFDRTAPELLAVAAHLLGGDDGTAQDALQATFLTAIEDAARWDAQRPLLPWLLGILANHVRKERRSTRRFAGGDADAILAEVADLADVARPHAAEGREFSAAVDAALQRLDPPFREALVLHLRHGLTAAEIGQALGRPAGTVRTQIARGLDRLRRLLPAGFAAGAAVLASPRSVLAAARAGVLRSLPGAAGAVASSWLFRNRRFAMLSAAAVLVFAAALSPWFGGAAGSPSVASVVDAPAPATAADATTPTDADAGARELLAGGAAPQPQGPPTSAPVAVVVTRQADGAPVPHAPVQILTDNRLREMTTDEQGRLAVDLPFPGLHWFYVAGVRGVDGSVPWPDFVRAPTGVTEVALKVPRGIDLTVRVVDADGSPVAGAVVESNGGSQIGRRFAPIGRTDAAGELRVIDATPGGQLIAWAHGHRPSECATSGGEVGKASEVVLTLPGAGLVARGIVRDETGAPLPHAQLALVQLAASIPAEPCWLESDDDGVFVLDTLMAGRHALVGVTWGPPLRRGELRFEHTGVGEPQLELRLTRGAAVTGRITDGSGVGIGNASLAARDRPEAVHQLPFLETFAKSKADGSFRLDALVPGRYLLESEHATSLVVDLRDGEEFVWNPVRAPLARAHWRLLDDRGEPLEGWLVGIVPPDWDWSHVQTLTGADGRTRHEGSYGFDYPDGAQYRLLVFEPLGKHDEWHDQSRFPTLLTPPLVVGPEHDVRVPRSARGHRSLRGELRDRDGAGIAGAKVRVESPALWQARTMVSTGHATAASGAGGFVVDDLPPGRYRVLVDVDAQRSIELPPVQIDADRDRDLGRVVVPEFGRLVVRVRATGDGAPPRLRVNVRAAGADGQWSLRRGRDGTYRSAPLPFGSYRLSGWSDAARVATVAAELDAPEREIEVVAEPCAPTRVVVAFAADALRNLSGWRGTLISRRGGETLLEQTLERDFHGRFEERMEFGVALPSGPQTIVLRSWDRTSQEQQVVVPDGGGAVEFVVR